MKNDAKDTMKKYTEGIELAELLALSLRGELSPEQERELEARLAEFPERERLLAEVRDGKALSDKMGVYDSLDAGETWESMRGRLTPATERPAPVRRRRLTALRWAAAIAVPALIVSAVALLTTRPPVAEPVQTASYQYDPTKTTLQLPSGKIVFLDTLRGYAGEQLKPYASQDMEGNSLDYTAQGDRFHLFEYHTITVPRGKDYKLRLADGTEVLLFADSEIKYPSRFTGDTRTVELRGEAFFNVAEDASKPFIVHTDGCDVRVLGTGFNVKAYRDMETVETSLLWGSVSVAGNTLEPGRQLIFDKTDGTVEYRDINTDSYMMRTRNMFVFEDMVLEDILAELARWYDFTPVFRDSVIKDKRFGLKLNRGESLDFVLHIFQLTGEVKFAHEDGKVYIENL